MEQTLAAACAVFACCRRPLAEGTVVMTPAIVLSNGVAGSDALELIEYSRPYVGVFVEATLGLVLFADASRIDLSALRREATVPARLLGIGLPLTIVARPRRAGAAGELTRFEAAVLAVVLAPTDAALGQAVVTEKRLPSRIRQGLKRREWSQRRCSRAAAPDRARGGRGRVLQETTGGAVQLVAEQIGYAWSVASRVARRRRRCC